MNEIPLLIITGAVGVGKTTVADEIFELLKDQSKPVALINLDELGYAFPKPQDDPLQIRLRFKNLATIWPNYDGGGARALIIPYVIENRDILTLFHTAIPNAKIFVIRLEAPFAVLKERIRNRPMGGDETWHLKRAEELTAKYELSTIEDVSIDTVNKTISQVAQEVIAAWPDIKTL